MSSKKEDRSKNPHAGELALTDFKIDPSVQEKMFLNDSQFAVIGKITVHWGQVEADVSSSLFLLRGLIGSEEEAAKIDGAPLETRLAQLKVELEKTGDATRIAAIERLIMIAADVKWKRDALAHGSLLFDHQSAAPSFHLASRKKEFFLSEVHDLAATSSDAADIAREILHQCIIDREDRRGTPLHWMLGDFATSANISLKPSR